MRRILVALATLGIALAAALPYDAGATSPAYLTIQFGRSIEGSYNHTCSGVVPGILTLAEVQQDLATRGMVATGTVVVDRTNTTTTEDCYGGDIYADWSDLQGLQAEGWTFVSDGETHNDMTTMTASGQESESCGSLSAFSTYLPGDPADGLFAYGDDHFTTAIQTQVVAPCFYYGRTYRGGVNTLSRMNPNGLQNTNSITGGACNTVGLACYKPSGGQNGKHYMSPVKLAAMVATEQGNQWIDLQFYRLVSGMENDGPSYSWDCTSPNWALHWTSQTEMYCQNDFDAIIGSAPLTTVTADPATVANAWGRQMP